MIEEFRQVMETLQRFIQVLENAVQAVDRIADRQRINVDVTRMLYRGQQTTSLTKRYATPINTLTQVSDIHVCNVDANPVNFTMSIVAPAGTPAASDKEYDQIVVGPNGFFHESRELVLEAGWEIHLQASANNALNVTISGIEMVTA